MRLLRVDVHYFRCYWKREHCVLCVVCFSLEVSTHTATLQRSRACSARSRQVQDLPDDREAFPSPELFERMRAALQPRSPFAVVQQVRRELLAGTGQEKTRECA